MSDKKSNKIKPSEYKLIPDPNQSEDSILLDEEGCSWGSVAEWLFIGILGGCGCGSSEDIGKDVLWLFKKIGERSDERWKIYDQPYLEVIAHWFDSLELTEHGTSIAGAWLTEKGESIYKAILEYEHDQQN